MDLLAKRELQERPYWDSGSDSDSEDDGDGEKDEQAEAAKKSGLGQLEKCAPLPCDTRSWSLHSIQPRDSTPHRGTAHRTEAVLSSGCASHRLKIPVASRSQSSSACLLCSVSHSSPKLSRGTWRVLMPQIQADASRSG